jgi:hypothetical protein
MTRLRFTLAQLMAIVIYLGFGFAALRNADEFWASAAYTLAITLIAGATVGALTRHGKARAPWLGFAVFGWTYLLIVHLPDWTVLGFVFGPVRKPLLIFEWAAARLQPYVRSIPSEIAGTGEYLIVYEQVSRSLGVILFGLLGMLFASLLSAKDERPNP